MLSSFKSLILFMHMRYYNMKSCEADMTSAFPFYPELKTFNSLPGEIKNHNPSIIKMGPSSSLGGKMNNNKNIFYFIFSGLCIFVFIYYFLNLIYLYVLTMTFNCS